ncbi:MFS transporter [Nocardioides sambongensis]|uniref:MFS transporter n=1 Tax=Nocardioides sambongensis TaxID=2589074 RepID=UPI001129DC40|nr:MFS transporter [Nocardioides sambongensis]
MVRRYGAVVVTAAGSVAIAAALAVAGALGTAGGALVWLFAATMVLVGAFDAIVDTAQNVQGVVVEQWRGRSIMNSLHAVWSIGAASGGLIGAGCAAADVGLGAQMLVNGVVWGALAVVSSALAVVPNAVRDDLRDRHQQEHADAHPAGSRQARRRAWRLLAPLVLLAICGALVEDVANNWVVLFLGQEAGAPAELAGLGLTVVLGAQFVGRLLGDPMTDRWGRDVVARAGGLLIAAGSALVIVAPVYPLAFLGFALAGLGCATLVPAAFAAAARIPGLPEGTGIAVIGWLMRLGFLFTSPAIGALSDATSLTAAMAVPLVAGLVAAVLAHAAARTPRPTRVGA